MSHRARLWGHFVVVVVVDDDDDDDVVVALCFSFNGQVPLL